MEEVAGIERVVLEFVALANIARFPIIFAEQMPFQADPDVIGV